jgi:hypothetical protein
MHKNVHPNLDLKPLFEGTGAQHNVVYFPFLTNLSTNMFFTEAENEEHLVMKPVPPPETVGQEAAMKSPSGGGMFNLSLTNIRTEFKNMR